MENDNKRLGIDGPGYVREDRTMQDPDAFNVYVRHSGRRNWEYKETRATELEAAQIMIAAFVLDWKVKRGKVQAVNRKTGDRKTLLEVCR